MTETIEGTSKMDR